MVAEGADKRTRKSGEGGGIGLSGLIGYGLVAAAAILVAVGPVAVAVGCYLLALRKLSWRENLILAAAAAVGLAVGWQAFSASYLHWLVGFLPGEPTRWLPPAAPTVLLGLLLGALTGLTSGTAVGRRVTRKVADQLPHPFQDPLRDEGVVPNEVLRRRVESVSPPEGLMPVVPHPSGARRSRRLPHTTDPAGPVGRWRPDMPDEQASVPIGHDGKGRVVEVSLGEFGTHGMILGATGSGKALAVDTVIPTPDGATVMGRLAAGDRVFDEHGRAALVQTATAVWRAAETFGVTFCDGQRIVADGPHRWVTFTAEDPEPRIRTTAELAGTVGSSHRIAAAGPQRHARLDGVDPFAVGAQAAQGGPVGALARTGTVGQRQQALLSALCAAGGHCEPDGKVVAGLPTHPDLVDLAESLGAVALRGARQLTIRPPAWLLSSDGATGSQLTRRFGAAATRRLAAWAARCPAQVQRTVVGVAPAGPALVRCIAVDSPSRLYLAAGAVATHNTETIKSVSGGMLDLGVSGVVLDLKEDTAEGGLRDFYKVYAERHGLPFQELALSDPNPTRWFNPLAGMGPDEARDTILAQQRFDDEHWQNINKKMLGQTAALLYAAHRAAPERFEEPSMYLFGRVLSSGNAKAELKEQMQAVEAAFPGKYQIDTHFDALVNPSVEERKSARGYGAKLINLYETEVGQRVLLPGTGLAELDVTAPGITYIGLDTLGKADITRAVSTSVIQRMNVYASQRTVAGDMSQTKQPRFFFIDEANWVARRPVMNLLARARTAKVMVVLCTQGPTDWINEEGDDWTSMTNNINVAMVMYQGAPKAAELSAEFIGYQETLSSSLRYENHRVVDEGSVSKSVDFLVAPHLLRELKVGEMILRVGKPASRVSWVKVPMRNPSAHAPTAR